MVIQVKHSPRIPFKIVRRLTPQHCGAFSDTLISLKPPVVTGVQGYQTDSCNNRQLHRSGDRLTIIGNHFPKEDPDKLAHVRRGLTLYFSKLCLNATLHIFVMLPTFTSGDRRQLIAFSVLFLPLLLSSTVRLTAHRLARALSVLHWSFTLTAALAPMPLLSFKPRYSSARKTDKFDFVVKFFFERIWTGQTVGTQNSQSTPNAYVAVVSV